MPQDKSQAKQPPRPKREYVRIQKKENYTVFYVVLGLLGVLIVAAVVHDRKAGTLTEFEKSYSPTRDPEYYAK